MALSDRKKKLAADITRRMEAALEGDPRLWRHPLAEATVALLEKGVPVTADNLIAKLEATAGDEHQDVLLRRVPSQAAIDRLRQITMKKD